MSNEFDYDSNPGTSQQNQQQVPENNTSGYYHSVGAPNGRAAENVQSSGYQNGYAAPNTAPTAGQSAQSQTGEAGGTQGYQTPDQQSGYHAYTGGGGAVPPVNPMSGYHVENPQPPKKHKGGMTGKGVVAVALVCALVGGLCGGGIAAAVRGGTVTDSGDSSSAQVQETEEDNGSAKDATVFNKTTIDVTTNSTSTKMTPQDVYENYVNAVVLVYNQGTTSTYWGQTESRSSGSGMIISKDGYVLTNNHVVSGAEKLTVMTTSGEEYDATVIGADEVNDVALLKIEGSEDFPTVSIGNSDKIEVGQQVCAIGNPLGELTNTLTVGYVSALDREISESSTGTTINMFQTDCAINSGNSGGPIFDMNGNVVGITTAKYSSSGYSNSASVEGIGFCIPINDAMSIVNDLMQYGYVKGRVSMGVSVRAMDNTVAQYYNLPTGVYVADVTSGSAADNAGIQKGDLICAIDGDETTSVAALKQKLKDYTPGDTATVSIYRTETGDKLDVTITFDEMQAETTTENQQAENQQDQQDQQDQSQQGQTINPFDFFGN